MIKHLHCFFAVVKENETTSIIGARLKPFSCEDAKVQTGGLRSDAQVNICPQFLPGFPWSFFSSKELEERWQYKKLWIFWNKRSPYPEISSCFLSLYSILPKSNSSVKTISYPLTMTSLLWGGIFSDVVIYNIWYANRYKFRLYIHKYNWKDLIELFPIDLWQ